MTIHRPFGLPLICLALAALTACSSRPEVDPKSVPALSAMARTLLDGSRSDTVYHPKWPAGIRELLHPVQIEQIRIHPEGVYIVTSRSFVEEDGLFVPRDPATFQPDSGDPSYTLVALDVFIYHVAG